MSRRRRTALVTALLELVRDDSERWRIATAARGLARTFTLGRMAQAYEDLLSARVSRR